MQNSKCFMKNFMAYKHAKQKNEGHIQSYVPHIFVKSYQKADKKAADKINSRAYYFDRQIFGIFQRGKKVEYKSAKKPRTEKYYKVFKLSFCYKHYLKSLLIIFSPFSR